MSDDREPITGGDDNGTKDEKPKKKNKKDPPPPNQQNEDGESKGKCSCNTSFFLSIEGVLKIIEFVSFYL